MRASRIAPSASSTSSSSFGPNCTGRLAPAPSPRSRGGFVGASPSARRRRGSSPGSRAGSRVVGRGGLRRTRDAARAVAVAVLRRRRRGRVAELRSRSARVRRAAPSRAGARARRRAGCRDRPACAPRARRARRARPDVASTGSGASPTPARRSPRARRAAGTAIRCAVTTSDRSS